MARLDQPEGCRELRPPALYGHAWHGAFTQHAIPDESVGGRSNMREIFRSRAGRCPVALPVAAFWVQYAGILAERWYFFAEANHPQNLYYQAIA